jgi:hypothetical protein
MHTGPEPRSILGNSRGRDIFRVRNCSTGYLSNVPVVIVGGRAGMDLSKASKCAAQEKQPAQGYQVRFLCLGVDGQPGDGLPLVDR